MKKVLYVDDEEVNLFIFKVSFKDVYDVVTAQSGAKALELLVSNPEIKIVITDLRMPIMDGLEFVKVAKTKFGDKVFFLLTGFGITEEIKQLIDNNMLNNYFSKPFNKTEIISEVEKH
ncbi:MAG TPA: response regulator [Cyclobacteriaceae bacterium]|jgi:response regulator RpfG family c-di-GMP phosphodiesterase|nr:response regulator [Cyclobacteriaceae bacterium]